MCCLRMPLEANSWTAVSQRQCIGSEPYSQGVGRTESVVEVVTYLALVRVVKYANAASQVWLEGRGDHVVLLGRDRHESGLDSQR